MSIKDDIEFGVDFYSDDEYKRLIEEQKNGGE